MGRTSCAWPGWWPWHFDLWSHSVRIRCAYTILNEKVASQLVKRTAYGRALHDRPLREQQGAGDNYSTLRLYIKVLLRYEKRERL